LQSYSRFLLFIETIRENLKTAFFYPIIITVFLLANLLLLNFFVFPALFQEFIGKISEVPILMRALFFAEPTMWPFSLVLPGLIFWVTFSTIKTIWTGDWEVFRHSMIARSMKLNLFIDRQAEARIQSLIALYLGAGFSLVESISRASNSDPKISKRFELAAVADALKNGVEFKEAMEISPILEYFADSSKDGFDLELKLKKMAKLRFHSAKKDFIFMEKVASIVAVILAGILVMIVSLSFFSTYFWQLWEVIK
jgi:type II secretory pathway component PulF